MKTKLRLNFIEDHFYLRFYLQIFIDSKCGIFFYTYFLYIQNDTCIEYIIFVRRFQRIDFKSERRKNCYIKIVVEIYKKLNLFIYKLISENFRM